MEIIFWIIMAIAVIILYGILYAMTDDNANL